MIKRRWVFEDENGGQVLVEIDQYEDEPGLDDDPAVCCRDGHDSTWEPPMTVVFTETEGA